MASAMAGRKSSIALRIFQALAGVIFILYGIFSFVNYSGIENECFDLFISDWLACSILARVLISLQFTAGLLLNFNRINHGFSKAILLLVFAFFIIDVIYQYTAGPSTFSNSRIHAFPASVNYLLQAIVFIGGIAVIKRLDQTSVKYKWINAVVMVLLTGFTFTFNAVFPSEFKLAPETLKPSDQVSLLNQALVNQLPDLELDQIDHLAFLSTNCGHCARLASRLSIQQKNTNIGNTVAVFFSPKAQIEEFLFEKQLEIDYITIDDGLFFKFSGATLPSIVEFKEAEVVKRYSENRINFALFESLESQ